MPSIAAICKIIGFAVALTVLGVAISFIFTDSISVLNVIRIAYLMYQV